MMLTTYQAANKLGQLTKDYATNWGNVLAENSRSHELLDKKTGKYKNKGNHHVYGYIPFEKRAGKKYYKPEMIERLANAVLAQRAGSTLSIPELMKVAA